MFAFLRHRECESRHINSFFRPKRAGFIPSCMISFFHLTKGVKGTLLIRQVAKDVLSDGELINKDIAQGVFLDYFAAAPIADIVHMNSFDI